MTSIAPTSLKALARAYGGDVYAGGRRALLPAPGHSPADRSISLWLTQGRVVAHSFGASDWREVLDDLRAHGWIDAQNRLLRGGNTACRWAPPDLSRLERRRWARALWAEAVPVTDLAPAAAYGRRRAVALTGVPGLRAHHAAPMRIYDNSGPRLSALLAGVRDRRGAICAVEVTYLDAQGRPSRLARPARKLVGVLPARAAVRLAASAGEMLVAEGVFTTLSAMSRFRLPGWALLSTCNLRRWEPPMGVRRVLIAGDRGPDGERSAAVLCERLRQAGWACEVVLPPLGAGDWNDLAQMEAKEGRDGAPGPQGSSRAAGREPRHGRDRIHP